MAKWLGRVSAQAVMGNQAVVSEQSSNSSTVTVPEGEIDTGEDLPDPANAGGVEALENAT